MLGLFDEDANWKLTEESGHEESLDLNPFATQFLNGQDRGIVTWNESRFIIYLGLTHEGFFTWYESEGGNDHATRRDLEE